MISEFDFSPPKLTFQTNGEPRAQVTKSVSIMNKNLVDIKNLLLGRDMTGNPPTNKNSHAVCLLDNSYT